MRKNIGRDLAENTAEKIGDKLQLPISKIERLASCTERIDNNLDQLRQLAELYQPFFCFPVAEPRKLSEVIREAFRSAANIYRGVIGTDWRGEVFTRPLGEIHAHYQLSFQRPYRLLATGVADFFSLTDPQPTGEFAELVEMHSILTELRSGVPELFQAGTDLAAAKLGTPLSDDQLKRLAENEAEATKCLTEITELMKQEHPLIDLADLPAFINDMPSFMTLTKPESVFTSSSRVDPARIGRIVEENAHRAAMEFAFRVSSSCQDFCDGSYASAEELCNAMEDFKQQLVTVVGPNATKDNGILLAQLDIEATQIRKTQQVIERDNGEAERETPTDDGGANHVSIKLVPGGFQFQATTFDVTGKPWNILKVALSARDYRFTIDMLKKNAWDDEQPSVDTVRFAVGKLRKALREAFETNEDPLPHVGAGKDLAWKLIVPA